MYKAAPKTQQFVPYTPNTGNYRVRLDANESFLLPTPEDREKMAQAAAQVALNRYPDPLATDVCAAFAALYHLPPELVTAGNGSDELISVILSAFLQKGEKVLTLSPDFSMYSFYATITENPCVVIQKNNDLQIDVSQVIGTIRRENIRLFIFSNPCNPTSLGLGREQVRQIVTGTDALIVLDEAYMDFWDQSLLGEVADYDNLIILRTCSKALGLAALRLGFAVANRTLTGILQAAKSPYNVNAVTQAMATVLLQNPVYAQVYPGLLLESRRMLLDGFKRLESAGQIERVWDSKTNFVLIQTQQAGELYHQLAERGILVRKIGANFLRITAGTQEENAQVLAVVDLLTKR